MNAHTRPEAPIAVPHPTVPDRWTVTLLGAERTITREGRWWIAELCGELPQWTRKRAVAIATKDIEWQAAEHARAVALQDATDARLAKLSPDEFAYVLDQREQELAGLSVNSPGRADMLREYIRLMKEFKDVHA